MPIENTGPIRLRGAAGDGRTDINEEINGNVTDTDVSLGTLNTARYATVAEGNTPSGRSMSEMRGYAAFDSAFPSTEADGALGESLVYDTNSSSYASFTPSFDGNRKTWTVSAWVKFNRTGSRETIISQGSTSVLDVVHMTKHSDDKLRIYIERSGGEISILGGSLILDTSGWYNIVFAFDATKSYTNDKCRIYVNGIEDTGVTISGTFTDSDYGFNKANNPIRIGQYRYTNSYYLDGVIADFKFIDGKQLRPDSFGELVQGIWIPKAFNTASTDTLVTSNLTANYDFVNGSMEDSSGNGNHLTKNNTGGQYYANNYGFWETPGSTAQFLKMPDIINSHSTTISMWIHPTSTGVRELFFHATKEIYGIWERTSSNKYQVYFGSAGYVIQNIEAENKWVMLTLTTHGARDVKFYIDGILVNEVTASSDLQQNYNYYDNTLGYTHHTSTPNDGKMGFGEVQIYSVGLNPDQVKQNYNATKHKYTYGLNGFWLPLNNTSTGSIDSSSNLKLHLDASDSSSYGGSGTTWSDLTSNNNDGTISGASFLSSTNGGVFSFDGSNDKVDLNSLQSFFGQKQTFTVELWFNAPSSSTGNRSLFDDYNYSNQNIALYLYNGALNYFGRYNNNDIGGINSGSVTYNDNKWHHVIVTSDQSTIKLYADGKLIDSGSVPSASYSGGTPSVGIGRQTHPGSSTYSYFEGKIAQVRVYDKALTAQEIITNYRATQGNYEQVSTVDISGNANSFTATNIDYTDHIPDEPLDNYATLSPSTPDAGLTFSEGNLKAVATSAPWKGAPATIGVTTGKWYYEVKITQTNTNYGQSAYTANGAYFSWGITNNTGLKTYNWLPATGAGDVAVVCDTGTFGINSSTTSPHYGQTQINGTAHWAVNDVIGLALDADTGVIQVYKNGSALGSSVTLTGDTYLPFVIDYPGQGEGVFNFGQKPWEYSPPANYNGYNTANLTAPAFDPDGATPDKPSNYFKAVTYQGNGGTQGEAYGYKEGSRAAVFNGSSSRITIPEISPDSISMWINLDTLNRYDAPLGHSTNTANYIYWADSSESYQLRLGGSLFGSGTAKDTVGAVGGWVNVIFVDNGSGTVTCYINGNSAGSVSGSLPSFNEIGGRTAGTDQYLQGKIDEVRFFDKVLNSTEIGYLADDDTSNIDAISNLVAHYDMEGDANNADIISTNFATWDATLSSIPNYSEGNLRMTGGNGNKIGYSNEIVSSGKWYWEHEVIAIGAESSFGIARPGDLSSHYVVGTSSTSWGLYVNGNIYHNGSNLGSYMSGGFTNGDIIGVELDIDNGTLEFYKNGTGYGNAFTGLSGEFVVAAEARTTSGINDHRTNFGASAWDYTPSTGFSGIYLKYNGTSNNVTYTQDKPYGNIDVGFKPDFVWIKSRDATPSHKLFDSVRGINKPLSTNGPDQEYNNSPYGLTSFDSNGFTIADITNGGYAINGAPGQTYTGANAAYVAWAWKAGGKAVENTDGTITSQVSANQDAGFSIVTWTGDGNDATVGHGLSSQPEFVITKGRANLATYNQWTTYHKDLQDDYVVYLNLTNAEEDGIGDYWRKSAFSNTVFGLGNDIYGPNVNGTTMVAYCFHSVDGFSKIGSYTGNGSTDGPFVYTGFKPAFVMLKRTDAGSSNWFIIDNARKNVNPNGAYLLPNASNTENDLNAYSLKFFSNGYKLNSSDVQMNANGGTYIYMAFAEDPVKYSNGVATLGDGNEFIQGGNYPEDNFNTTTYTGAGAAQKITTGIDADFVWAKTRTFGSVTSHRLVDTLRGPKNHLYLPNTLAQTFDAAGITIEDDGFSFAGNEGANLSGAPTVAWSWKAAGNANTYNILENGTVTSSASASTLGLDTGTITPTGVSANRDNGFSIVKYNGGQSSGTKVAHGLSKPPELIIVKNISDTASWPVLTKEGYTIDANTFTLSASSKYLALNSTTNYINYVFDQQLGGTANGGLSTDQLIAYCWHSVPGFSKIGSYKGNGSSSARKIYTGFEPAFIMIKNATGVYEWTIIDNKRGGNTELYPNTSGNENSQGDVQNTTFASDGFILNAADGATNQNNATIIYMAFAHR